MKYLLLSLFISAQALAGNGSGNVSSVIGLGAVAQTVTPTSSVPLSNLSGAAGTYAVFSLYVGNDFGSNTYSELYKNGVVYQVPAGKSAYCFNITASSSGGANLYQLVSATAAIGSVVAGPITGGVYQSGSANKFSMRTGATTGVPATAPGVYVFGPSTYPGVNVPSAASYEIHMDCYEN